MPSKLEVRVDLEEGGPLESVVDADIMEFDAYFQSLGNDPIVRSEVAILKTYLYWRLYVVGKKVKDGSETGS